MILSILITLLAGGAAAGIILYVFAPRCDCGKRAVTDDWLCLDCVTAAAIDRSRELEDTRWISTSL